jgi:exonuclease III
MYEREAIKRKTIQKIVGIRRSGFFDLMKGVPPRRERFHIISYRYRNRRKRFGLRFNLIAAIYNFEL